MNWLALLAVLFAFTGAEGQPRASGSHVEPSLLAELEFRDGSARLPRTSRDELARIAGWARTRPDGLVVIDGHADARGPAAGDIRLSFARAKLVRDHLVALGVNPYQIIISAFPAEDRPRARVAVWGTRDRYGARPSRVGRR